MADRLADIEARLSYIERRLSMLETQRGLEPLAAAGPKAPGALGEESVSNAATHLGRVLLIIGGAYLLRAITDFGFLPTQAGIPIGAAYALLWLYMAWRFGSRAAQRTPAMLYGGVSVLLVLPILVEAVTHFDLLGGTSSAVALVAVCAAALSVAAIRNLRSIAWLIVGGAMGTAFVLLRASGAAITFSALAVVLGLVTYWIVYYKRWRVLHWFAALGADAAVVLLAVLAASEHWTVDPRAAYFLGVTMWGAYLVSFALRTHVLGSGPGFFEPVQTLVASAVVCGVAVRIGPDHPGYIVALGLAALVFGIVAFGLGFAPHTREARGRSFYFYSTLGLVLVLGGSGLLVPAGAAGTAWAVLGVGLAWVSGRQERVSMSLQCAVALLAAGIISGTLSEAYQALLAGVGTTWPAVSVPFLVVAAASVACLFIPVAQRSERWGTFAGLPQLIVLLLAVWTVSGLFVTVAGPLLAGAPGPETDLGKLATLRTAVLAAASVTLAYSSRHARWPEARWLAYPVLVAVGAKLVFEDFPHGRPATLFLALGFVGGALILVSKFMRRKKKAAEEKPPVAEAPSEVEHPPAA